jgi:hypothetical protein
MELCPFGQLMAPQMYSYLREQAEVLCAMSRETIDLGMARRLRILAADFQERAAELERNGDPNIEPKVVE